MGGGTLLAFSSSLVIQVEGLAFSFARLTGLRAWRNRASGRDEGSCHSSLRGIACVIAILNFYPKLPPYAVLFQRSKCAHCFTPDQ